MIHNLCIVCLITSKFNYKCICCPITALTHRIRAWSIYIIFTSEPASFKHSLAPEPSFCFPKPAWHHSCLLLLSINFSPAISICYLYMPNDRNLGFQWRTFAEEVYHFMQEGLRQGWGTIIWQEHAGRFWSINSFSAEHVKCFGSPVNGKSHQLLSIGQERYGW